MKNFVFFSGGRDSLVLTHKLSSKLDDFKVVFIDTGIAYPKTVEYVKNTCEKYGWDLIIIKSDYDYFDYLIRYGFPNPVFRWCMRILKIEALKKLAKKYPNSVFHLGIRASESTKRLKIYKRYRKKHFDRKLGVFISLPLLDWSHTDIVKYIKKHNLPENPAYRDLGFSADCLCLAFATKWQLFRIKQFYSEYWQRIMEAYYILKETNDERKYTLHNFLNPLEIQKQECLCLLTLTQPNQEIKI
jgi:phosphoadenosine phosphosulfate reductase